MSPLLLTLLLLLLTLLLLLLLFIVYAGFGGPGSLSVSSLITSVLKGLPLKLTGYCGLMLAVCEDQVRE
jgi:hypothetical protein